MKRPIIFIVIPCYNEEKCVIETTKRLSKKLATLAKQKIISEKSKILFVDDCSKDNTWNTIKNTHNERVIGLKLAHNQGHQNAIYAGLMYAKEHSDVAISMDADLQNDIEAIDKMIKKYHDGFEIVYAIAKNRKQDSLFKRSTAKTFYKLMQLLGVELISNAADYRLMSKKALTQLEKYQEVNLFLRGIVPLIGLKWTTINYTRKKRFDGESKYSSKRMLSFAWDGITSFSIKPLKAIVSLGIIILSLSLVTLLFFFIQYCQGNTVNETNYIICSICLLGGLQIISIGLVGQYVGKTYIESKHRPRYMIEELYESGNNSQKEKDES